MSFRDNLQYLRAQRNMTQEHLAMLLGVSRQSVTKWEAEKSFPEMDKLLRICQIFNCSLDELVQGDLTTRTMNEDGAHTHVIPVGPPQDIVGYDEHYRMLARKIATGSLILGLGFTAGMIISYLATYLPLPIDGDAAFLASSFLMGIFALALIIPAVLDHKAFVRAHPFIEDFYTEAQKQRVRSAFVPELLVGIGICAIGFILTILLESYPDELQSAAMLGCGSIGAWFIVHASIHFNRIRIDRYNQRANEYLSSEEIECSSLEERDKQRLLASKHRSAKQTTVFGAIMGISTVIGIILLFMPILTSPDPKSFNPQGTSAMWFWLVWPIGALIGLIVTNLMNGFDNKDD